MVTQYVDYYTLQIPPFFMKSSFTKHRDMTIHFEAGNLLFMNLLFIFNELSSYTKIQNLSEHTAEHKID